MSNYYQLLNIPEYSDIETIKKAYYKLSSKYHPDNYVNESEEVQKINNEKQKRLNQIYQFLSDKNNKKKYDDELRKTSSISFSSNVKETNELNTNNRFKLKLELEAQAMEIQKMIFKRESELTREIETKITSLESYCSRLHISPNLVKNDEIYLSFYSDEIEKLHNNKLYKTFPNLFKRKEEDLLSEQRSVQKKIDNCNKQIDLLREQEEKLKVLKEERKNILENDSKIIELRVLLNEINQKIESLNESTYQQENNRKRK